MGSRAPIFSLRLVREGSTSYKAYAGGSAEAVAAVRPLIGDEPREVLVAIALTTKGRIIGMRVCSAGTLAATLIHPREVFQFALLTNASSIILVHNHPSGDPTPSSDDVIVAERMREAGDMIGIPITDFIVLGDPGFESVCLGFESI